MPGAPNRPPTADASPPAPPADPLAERRALRRLAPARVALALEMWKGSAPVELRRHLAQAEAAFARRDLHETENALDLLSVRLAEPRWPTLPEPFRQLRQAIPPPVPPHWDPDHGLAGPEREARRDRRRAETDLTLAEATVAWAAGRAIAVDDLRPALQRARGLLTPELPTAAPEFWEAVDSVYASLYPRLPPSAATP